MKKSAFVSEQKNTSSNLHVLKRQYNECLLKDDSGWQIEFWSQDEHQTMYGISLLKLVVVLSTSEVLQTWMAPYCTDVNRVACKIDVCILEQESLRQTKMIM
jgi:hypothetical protein